MAFGAAGRMAGRKLWSSSPRGGSCVPSATRGGSGSSVFSAARGGSGVFSAARGGRGVLSTARGRNGVYPAPGCGRGFSSSSWSEMWADVKPSKGTMALLSVLGSVTASASYGYHWMSSQVEAKTNKYVDEKLVEFKSFQNTATGTHHETVRKFYEANHEFQRELSEMRSRILALEQKEFQQRKELLLAADIISKYQVDAAAAKGAAN